MERLRVLLLMLLLQLLFGGVREVEGFAAAVAVAVCLPGVLALVVHAGLRSNREYVWC